MMVRLCAVSKWDAGHCYKPGSYSDVLVVTFSMQARETCTLYYVVGHMHRPYIAHSLISFFSKG